MLASSSGTIVLQNKMAKKSKLSTPEWIKEGYDSLADYNKSKGIKAKKSKGKVYHVKVCPKCASDEVGVKLVGEEGKRADNWECRKCKWAGKDVEEKELSEDEFLKMMEKKE